MAKRKKAIPKEQDDAPNIESAPETADNEENEDLGKTNETGAESSGNGESNGLEACRDTDQDSLRDMMAANYLEYASYVIRDRAIPDVNDGLKPVQRRILHSLHIMDDGRFHKVANVIGHTMQYHPHGDASIGNALVVLANKRYFIERQGNFGNIYTGDPASASRYIECRLTPLAREVMFNREITEFIPSYDGRNQEPVTLPAKVPSLLMIGSDGIAVGMSTRILPHNFCELLEAQIAILQNEDFSVYPDFIQGGVMDVSDYEDGLGRIVLRAVIDTANDKTLVIREIPATTTTEGLINSIEDATKKGKIKIASINDYTAENVEIEIALPRGIHADEAIKQLYAYTDCEVSISSNMLVIKDNMPVQMTVSDVLRHNTDQLVDYLKRELEIELGKLHERFHERTLAEIFIENRIYKRIEECESMELVMAEVRKGLEKFRHLLKRDITDEDIEKLLQIPIRRISRFDINKNHEELDKIAKAIEETNYHLAHLRKFTIAYIKNLLKKYGKDYERCTKISDIEQVDVRKVALKNIKVGHDRQGQFVGTEVRNSNKNEPPLTCTEFDRLVLLKNDGTFKVVAIPDKLYVGPVKYLFRANKEQVYSMIYRDRKRGIYYAKRFQIQSYIMDKEYRTIPKGCIIEAIYTNYNVVVRAELKPNSRRSVNHVDIAFNEIEMRSTGARGFKVTGYPVENLSQLKRGTPTPDADEEMFPTPETAQEDTLSGDDATPAVGNEDLEPPDEEAGDEASEDIPDETVAEDEQKKAPEAETKPEAPKRSRGKTASETETETEPPEKSEEGKETEPKGKAGDKTKKSAKPEEAPAEPSPPRDVVQEWQERTRTASAGRKKPASSDQAEEIQSEKDGPQKSKENTPPKSTSVEKPKKKSRIVIDEETPFFLE